MMEIKAKIIKDILEKEADFEFLKPDEYTIVPPLAYSMTNK
jgi:hypothetical protein